MKPHRVKRVDPRVRPGDAARPLHRGTAIGSLRPARPAASLGPSLLLGAAGCSFPSRVESRDRFCGGQKLSGQVAVSGDSFPGRTVLQAEVAGALRDRGDSSGLAKRPGQTLGRVSGRPTRLARSPTP